MKTIQTDATYRFRIGNQDDAMTQLGKSAIGADQFPAAFEHACAQHLVHKRAGDPRYGIRLQVCCDAINKWLTVPTSQGSVCAWTKDRVGLEGSGDEIYASVEAILEKAVQRKKDHDAKMAEQEAEKRRNGAP